MTSPDGRRDGDGRRDTPPGTRIGGPGDGVTTATNRRTTVGRPGRSGSFSHVGYWVAGLGLLLALLAVVVAVDAFVLGIEGQCQCTPAVSLDRTYHPDNETFVLGHAGGDSLTVENTYRLALTVDGELVGTVGLPFEVGDRAVVGRVDPDATVRLIWHDDDRDRESQVLAEFHLGADR